MKTRIFYLFLCLSAFSAQIYSQTTTGKVVDEQQQPVPYANIVLLSLPDSAFVAGSISNEQGIFLLDFKGSKGLLRISSIGYVTTCLKYDGNQDAGIIRLQSDTQLLGEVVVKGNLPITRMKVL